MEEADNELLGALVTALRAMQAHSATEIPTLVADMKQKTHLLMDELERLALTGCLDDFIDVMVNRMVESDQPDRSVC